MKLIRGISGIRGIVGQTLTESVVINHIRAFSKIQESGTILVARDSRSHGGNLIDVCCRTLQKCGRDIQNFDIIPTPTAQFVIEKNDLAGGIVITASHNPEEWNGLKFIDSDGCFLNSNKNLDLFNIADNISGPYEKDGNITMMKSGYLPHIEHTKNLSVIDILSIKNRNFTVVVDAVNGAASLALPKMMESLGCKVYSLNCKPDGYFPRGTEPIPDHLIKLSEIVVQKNADVGFATDPDGDRLAVVDENGYALGEEYTLTICADGLLKSTGSNLPIVTNLSTTISLDRIAENYGNLVIRTAVGEINVVEQMKECNALLGGEGNGGIILSESHYGRDSLVGATLFLNRMAQDHQTVSQIFESMPQFIMLKDKIELGSLDAQSAFEKIQTIFSDAETNTMDGLKLTWENSWVHIRKSNTESIIRIYAEAPTNAEVKILINRVKSVL